MSPRLPTLVATTLVAGCLCALTATGVLMASPSVRAWTGLFPHPQSWAGASEPLAVPAHVYAGAPRTVVVVADSTCAGSQFHLAHLRDVLTNARQAGIGTHLVLTGAARPDDAAFVEALGMSSQYVTRHTPTSATLRWVPAVFVTDTTGRILRGWMPGDGVTALQALGALLSAEREPARQ